MKKRVLAALILQTFDTHGIKVRIPNFYVGPGSQFDALNTNFIMYITVSASNIASYKYRPQSTSRTDPYQSQCSFA